MHITLRKFLTTFIVAFLLFFLSSTVAFADNDDASVPTCTINVGGTAALATADRGSAPQVPANGYVNPPSTSPVFFNISATLPPAAMDNARLCPNNEVRISIYRSLALGWQEFSATLNGNVITGVFNISAVEVSRTSGERDIDVECSNGYPICHRAFAKFNGEEVQGTDQNCQAERDTINQALAALPSTVSLGSDLTVNLPNLDRYKQYCGAPFVDWSITRSGDQVGSGQNLSGGFTFTPTSSGTTFILQLTSYRGVATSVGIGRGSQVDPSEGSAFSHTFCVAQGGDCNPPSPAPAGNGAEQITTFSLCRQIPILTQADIDRQVNSVPDNKKQQVRTDLITRATKQAVEKAKCCQCAFGSADVDASTGACRGELDSGYKPRKGFTPGIYTSLGCIGAESESIVTTLVRIGLGIAGGVALLMILAGAFIFSTSQGEPKKASEAKELITSAVLGLIFIIFSVTILQFIGVTILRIPGFGG